MDSSPVIAEAVLLTGLTGHFMMLHVMLFPAGHFRLFLSPDLRAAQPTIFKYLGKRLIVHGTTGIGILTRLMRHRHALHCQLNWQASREIIPESIIISCGPAQVKPIMI